MSLETTYAEFLKNTFQSQLRFLLHINYMLQAFERQLWLYADDTCSLFNIKILPELKQY